MTCGINFARRFVSGLVMICVAAAFCLWVDPSVAASGVPTGIWRSQGYGVIAAIEPGGTSLYDITESTCVHHTAWPWTDLRLAENGQLSDDGRSFTATGPWGLTTLRFDRMLELPVFCRDKNHDAHDALYNFDVLWQTFSEHYAFFAARGVDWNATRERFRPLLNSDTPDPELQRIFAEMFRGLQDRHTMLIADKIRVRAGLPAIVARWYADYERDPVGPPDALLRSKLVEFMSPAWQRYLDSGSIRQVSGNVTAGTAAKGRVAYVSIAAESGYVTVGSQDDDVRAALTELGELFASFAGRQGLIVDLRMNVGGSDEVGLGIAGLLTNRDRPGFSKCARDRDGTTPVQKTIIRHARGAFVGPTVVLISPLTASAAENLTMMVKDYPNIILVGDRTSGVHSDPLIKSLPNGWRFMLSNERFVAPDGTSYEGMGIPPDVLVAFDPDALRTTGIDPILEKALDLLASGRFSDLAARARRPTASGRHLSCG